MKILRFYNEGCGPCGSLQNFLLKEGIKTTGVNISTDEGFEIASNHNVMAVPTLIFMDENGEIDRVVGFSSAHLAKILEIVKTSQ